MRYPQEFIDKVSESANVVDIISQYTQLKHTGGGFMGRCPFPDHKEKTPSFSVSEAKQVYHCFGCKKSGNVFKFLHDYNGMSFPEALVYLADKYGISVPQTQAGQGTDQAQQNHDRKKLMLKANKLAADYFREILKRAPLDSGIRKYIQKRKLSPEIVEEFQIGYSPMDWDLLTQHLHRHQIPDVIAEEVKLVSPKKDKSGYIDFFRDRLMFPIHSPSGEVLAFGGRIHDQGEPKYKNSPETPVFIKGKVLYGLYQTAKYVRSEDQIVIVEGYMDLVSVYQAGLKNLAATMGTALTPEHAKLIKRLTTNVVVLFDSDEAGQMAAERSLSILLAQGLYPRGLVLHQAKDPDEFIQNFGVDELQNQIKGAPELFSLILQSWMLDYRGEASQKVKLVDRVKPVFDVMVDQRLKSLYAEEMAQKMGVTLEWLRSAFTTNYNATGREQRNPGQLANQMPAQRTENNPTAVEFTEEGEFFKIKMASQAEILLVKLLIKSRANMDWILGQQSTLDLQQLLSQIAHIDIRRLVEKLEQVYRQDPNKFDKLFSLLINKIDVPELLFDKSQVEAFDLEKEQKLLADTVKKIQQNFIKEQTKKLVTDIKQSKSGANNQVDIEKLKEFSELQKNRLSLKK